MVRSLWGKDKGGKFRTHGRWSVASVRGTRWLTQDRCDGTLTKVTEGAVDVWVRSASGRFDFAPANGPSCARLGLSCGVVR